jgi:hypothetical protein
VIDSVVDPVVYPVVEVHVMRQVGIVPETGERTDEQQHECAASYDEIQTDKPVHISFLLRLRTGLSRDLNDPITMLLLDREGILGVAGDGAARITYVRLLHSFRRHRQFVDAAGSDTG